MPEPVVRWSHDLVTAVDGPAATERRPGLAATVGLYTLARLGLVAVVTALLLVAGVPLVIAVLVGLIVALPLSMVLFRGLRGRLDAALAERA